MRGFSDASKAVRASMHSNREDRHLNLLGLEKIFLLTAMSEIILVNSDDQSPLLLSSFPDNQSQDNQALEHQIDLEPSTEMSEENLTIPEQAKTSGIIAMLGLDVYNSLMKCMEASSALEASVENLVSLISSYGCEVSFKTLDDNYFHNIYLSGLPVDNNCLLRVFAMCDPTARRQDQIRKFK